VGRDSAEFNFGGGDHRTEKRRKWGKLKSKREKWKAKCKIMPKGYRKADMAQKESIPN
jgi:hypothetical protein